MYTPQHLRRWTLPSCYIGAHWDDYYSSGVGQSRDSGPLERSNFTTMLALLGGESETVDVVSENHWAVGWVEWIAIHETDEKALRAADEAQAALENYPVLDEEHYSQLEHDDAALTWENCYDDSERLGLLREHCPEIPFRDARAAVRGDMGYALSYDDGALYETLRSD